MNVNSPAPKPSRRFLAALALIGLLGLMLVSGCARRQSFTLRYDPARAGAPPGKVFLSARIAIAPAVVPLDLDLGGIFDPQGYRRARFEVPDLSRQVTRVLATALAGAGLDTVMIGGALDPDSLPGGVDFVVTEEVHQLNYVNYGGGPDGVVDASAELAVTLAGRGGQLHTSTVMAALNRGPGSITRAAFSTGGIGPDQVLSAVLSSAFVKLMADPDFARILPQRNLAATAAPVAAAPEFPDPDPPAIPARPARRRRYYTEHQPAEPPPDLSDEADDRDQSDQNWSEVEGAPPPLPRFRIDLGSHRGVAAEAPAPTAAAQEEPAPSLAPSQTPAPGTLYPPPISVAPAGQGPDLSGP